MNELSYLYGAVYIFENSEAQRVKVGLTTNKILGRLEDVNDMWLERKVTCQICGGRLVNFKGYVPHHILSGIKCSGGNALPLERDVSLAQSHLKKLKGSLPLLSGSQKGSITRKIKTLEKRIDLYKSHNKRVGIWKFSLAFITKDAEKVESLSHKILSEYLDKTAPFGEVFCCSVSEATAAVETALKQLDLLQFAKRKIQL